MSVVQIGQETFRSDQLDHGHIAVGTSAAQLLDRDLGFKSGIILYASSANVANIWIGRESVTADADSNTGGFPLVPGSSVELPIAELNSVFGVSTSAAQDLAWIGV